MTLHRRTVPAFVAVADSPEPFATLQSAGFAKGKPVTEAGKIFAD